jgi:hypothetical protein|tara:strand:+ start:704 stop:1138 length:435 start_codon:yes stop_codon:yes gene_type:complete
MQSDYLKYWKVIRHFIKSKYGLSVGDLDMILFLYSEKYFDKGKFDEFANVIGWNAQRFERLRQKGWIEVFRKGSKGLKALYGLSYKTKRVVKSIYNKLEGEEIPTSQTSNPMFAKNVSYSDKVYRNMIIEMNKFIKQQRHHSEK